MRSRHNAREDRYQHVWDNSVPPVLTMHPNEPVTLQTRDAGNDQITRTGSSRSSCPTTLCDA